MENKEYRNISELRNWEKNPRSIKGKDFQRLKKQVEKLGQYKPLLVTDDGEVIGGNMRLRAYKELGINDVWVSVINPKDENEKLEYALSDNDRAGFYDDDLLANMIPEFDIDWSGYAVDLGAPTTLDSLLPEEEIEEDEAPEVEEGEPDSKLGEVYQLGRHRLMCGDATKIEDVEKLMNGNKADMVFTDPPYGMDLDTDWSNIKGSDKAFARVKGGKYDRVIGDNEDYDPSHIFEMFGYVKEMFLFGADYYAERLQDKNKGSWLVWDKRKPSQENAIGSEFELVWSKTKHKRRVLRHDWFGFLSSENTQDARNRVHPTQKPITLLVDVMSQWGKNNDIVLDLFGGSGSTLIACEQTDRTCYMMELDPKYCDVIRKRYEQYKEKE